MGVLKRRFERALVVGAGRGLGFALTQALLERNPDARVLATHRKTAKPLRDLASRNERLRTLEFDPLGDHAQLIDTLNDFGPLDLVLNAIGFLHDETRRPEKALAEITLDHLRHAFDVNAFVTPLLAKTTKPFLTRDKPSAFVALSAKVGSIGDNRLGGWHSYRASKAALNMFIKNIALEFRNGGPRKCVVLAIHPGTTQTDLSAPFSGRVKHKIWSAPESAAHILDVIENAAPEPPGAFLNWDGTPLPW